MKYPALLLQGFALANDVLKSQLRIARELLQVILTQFANCLNDSVGVHGVCLFQCDLNKNIRGDALSRRELGQHT